MQRTITIEIALENSSFNFLTRGQERKADARQLAQLIEEMPPNDEHQANWKRWLLEDLGILVPKGFEADVRVGWA